MPRRTYEASGPNLEARSCQSLGSAISIAQNYACQADQPGTWYAREEGETKVLVERLPDGGVITYPREER